MQGMLSHRSNIIKMAGEAILIHVLISFGEKLKGRRPLWI